MGDVRDEHSQVEAAAVLGQLAAEDQQVFFRLDEVGHIVGYRRRVVLEMPVEPREDRAAELRRVAVGGEVLDEVKMPVGPQLRVLAADAVRNFTDAQLDSAAPLSLNAGAPMTAQFVIEDHALRHAWHHLARIRAALSREREKEAAA